MILTILRSSVLLSLLTLVTNNVVFASAKEQSALNPNEISSYSSIVESSQLPIQSFFLELLSMKAGVGFYITPKSVGSLLVTRFNPQLPDMDCKFAFCKDQDLKADIASLVKKGRLILITHGFYGFTAAAAQDNTDFKSFKDKFVDINQDLNSVIITPLVTRDILAHEMQHAQDNEADLLTEVRDFSRILFERGLLSAGQARRLSSAIAEIRAYHTQSIFFESQHRQTEYLVESDIDTLSINTKVVSADEFLRNRRAITEFKIKYYSADIFEVLKLSTLESSDRSKLMEFLKILLPINGPYSFKALIQPKLEQKHL